MDGVQLDCKAINGVNLKLPDDRLFDDKLFGDLSLKLVQYNDGIVDINTS